jgi:hypothetical protein
VLSRSKQLSAEEGTKAGSTTINRTNFNIYIHFYIEQKRYTMHRNDTAWGNVIFMTGEDITQLRANIQTIF